jgi:hypothetical protein
MQSDNSLSKSVTLISALSGLIEWENLIVLGKGDSTGQYERENC